MSRAVAEGTPRLWTEQPPRGTGRWSSFSPEFLIFTGEGRIPAISYEISQFLNVKTTSKAFK